MKNDPDLLKAAAEFSALSHETRLIVFKAIMAAGPAGLTAGDLADLAEVSPSNLSAHLNILANSGLVTVRRDGRRRYYAAQMEAIAGLVRFLVEDCCNGHPEVCADLPTTMKTSLAS